MEKKTEEELKLIKSQISLLEYAKKTKKEHYEKYGDIGGDGYDKVLTNIDTFINQKYDFIKNNYGLEREYVEKNIEEPEFKDWTKMEEELEKEVSNTKEAKTKATSKYKNAKRKKIKEELEKNMGEIKDVKMEPIAEEDIVISEDVVYNESTEYDEIKEDRIYSKFDFTSIPDYVQYDVIPLPSRGECYSHKKGKVPISYLTASDENLFTSLNMYRDGNLMNVILSRKILDKDFKIDELIPADRDLMILWLRMTSYGANFPLKLEDPISEKEITISADLRNFKAKESKLKADEDGCYDFQLSNGDIIKFRFLNIKQEKLIAENSKRVSEIVNKNLMQSYLKEIEDLYEKDLTIKDKEESEILSNSFENIKTWLGDYKKEENNEKINNKELTLYMYYLIDSIIIKKSNKRIYDREFIKNYIENMRAGDAYNFRIYVKENTPYIDFRFAINRYDKEIVYSTDVDNVDREDYIVSFLTLDDFIFLNV